MAVKTGEIRCSGCNKLLAKGLVKDGRIEIKCQCKTVNVIERLAPTPKRVPFQERLNLVQKQDDSLSFTIKKLPE